MRALTTTPGKSVGRASLVAENRTTDPSVSVFRDYLLERIATDLKVLLENGWISDVDTAIGLIRKQVLSPATGKDTSRKFGSEPGAPENISNATGNSVRNMRDNVDSSAASTPPLPARANSVTGFTKGPEKPPIRHCSSVTDVLKHSPTPFPCTDASTVVCIKPFNSDVAGDLRLRVGDVVENVEDVDPNWYKGTLNGQSGIFPKTFVESRTRPVPPLPSAPPLPSRPPQTKPASPPRPASSSVTSPLTPGGWFYIQCRANSNVFSVEANSLASGALINVQPQHAADAHPATIGNQLFRFENGFLINKRSNLVLDTSGSELRPRAQLVQADKKEDRESQHWVLGTDGSIRNSARPQFVLLEDLGSVIVWEDDGTLGRGASVWKVTTNVSKPAAAPAIPATPAAPAAVPAQAEPAKKETRSDRFTDTVVTGVGAGFGLTVGHRIADRLF
ncbi:uncharacterized protein SPPG_08038 [Spizellomyces punctatus DAOM BR117]|uniref:SH3 domain-containing protein n=1 Tax=Spizellomyces punctatus (strain DAOM BR117) TaxID=645134 RepID=A0A0L0H6B1_SPIPD|nr:uncharacterized protein SPPG_08038 [Spizellomyces punctatus DAOM BR117]KNC96446.1 hypothetical protein SPPG_08038 [Spizellomyces punctatus DAOM BR117]|eukprot:XP_016604486.1 hypothetical protein SPPG_08038 [Spizellomyces punctatus DAOM BR117]